MNNRLYNRTIDWLSFKNSYPNKVFDLRELIRSDIEVQVKYTTFADSIEDAIHSACPEINRRDHNRGQSNVDPPRSNGSPCLWGNEKCDGLIRLRRAKLAKFKFNRSSVNFSI